MVGVQSESGQVQALKEKLQEKENEMHHQKEQGEGLVHVLQTELHSLKKREKEQADILVELEQRLEQAGVSMNETTALINAIHLREEATEHGNFISQINITNILLLMIVVSIIFVCTKHQPQLKYFLRTGSAARKSEKDYE